MCAGLVIQWTYTQVGQAVSEGKNENDGRGTDGRMEQGIMAILKVPCRPSAQVS